MPTAQYPQAEDHERRAHGRGAQAVSAMQHPEREPDVEARADAQKDCQYDVESQHYVNLRCPSPVQIPEYVEL